MPMTTAHTLTRLIAAIVLCRALTGAVEAAEAEQYPIWWSPALELESLGKIDERLSRRFWPAEYGGLPMYRIVAGKEIRVEVENCVSLERRRAEGYDGVGNNNHKLAVYHTAWCDALRVLQDAKPAKVSYLRNFVMDADSVDYLPAFLNLFGSCHWMCLRYRANEEGVPLGRLEPEFDVEVVNQQPESLHELFGSKHPKGNGCCRGQRDGPPTPLRLRFYQLV